MKRLARSLAAFALIAAALYGYLAYQNNRTTPPVRSERIAQSYERSVDWLMSHRTEILQDGNAMLWWMIGESARVSGDARLQKLFEEFRSNYDRAAPYSLWQSFFHPQQYRNSKFLPNDYAPLADYQQYFLFAATCSTQLAQDILIEAQNNPNYCWGSTRFVRPACVTHQLMGYRFAQRNHCEVADLNSKIAALQATIERQLRYDPRVVDVYVQRVTMLVDSGATARLNPRWVERVIDAQRPDGGWSSIQPLFPLGGGRYFGFGERGVTIGRPESNFHTSAQGVWLMSLLLQK